MTTPFPTDVPITNCGYDPYPYGTAVSTCIEADHVYEWDIEICFYYYHYVSATYSGFALTDSGYCLSPGGEFNEPNQKVLGRGYPRFYRYTPEAPYYVRALTNEGNPVNCACTELVNGVEEPLKSWVDNAVSTHGIVITASCDPENIMDTVQKSFALPGQVCRLEEPTDYFRESLSWGVVGARIRDQYGNEYEVDPAGFPHTGFLDNLP